MKTVSPGFVSCLILGVLLTACGNGAAPPPASDALQENGDAIYCYSVCGDNLCDVNTEPYSCPQDCGSPVCGDHACCNENPNSCPEDCPYAADYCYLTPPFGFSAALPEKIASDTMRSVPQRICVPECGDHICDVNTESYNCPQDCGSPVCGDHACCYESPSTCPQDCPYAADYCYLTPPEW